MIDLRCGDARDVLKGLPDASVDAVCTDPPYALTSGRNSTKGFMGATWDHGQVAHDPAFWAEVLRVAKPGAFLLAFGGCRTYHRLVCAIEDGGWQPREMLNWVFATGFPKSKSCLKPAHEPILLAKAPGPLQPLQIDACRVATVGTEPNARRCKLPQGHAKFADVYSPMEGVGDGWDGAQGRWPPNTLLSHVGGPDGCQPAGVRRVPADKRGQGRPRGTFPHSDDAWGNGHRAYTGGETAGDGMEAQQEYVCHPQCPIRLLDEQAGPRTSGGGNKGNQAGSHGWFGLDGGTGFDHEYQASTGTASRFFPTFGPDPEDAVPFRYQPKAPPSERRLADGTPTGHPTQKPVALAQWLAALVCAPGGTILDPFAGVGSLGIGALRAGCHYLGIEQDAGYAAIAQRRLDEEQERQDGQLALPLGHACG